MNDQSIHQDNTAAHDLRSLILGSVTQIVCATIAKSSLNIVHADVPALFSDVFKSVSAAITGQSVTAEVTPQEPAVNPKKSVHDDFIICLEDGKRFKSLKRHIMTYYGLTPDAYRNKWGLKADYPMVAPTYAVQRSALAKKMGLGRKKGQRVAAHRVSGASKSGSKKAA